MFYNYYKPSESEYNDCISKGACSISPEVSAFKEVILMLLRQLSFYIIKLEELGAESDLLKLEILNSITEVFTHTDYSNEDIYANILRLYNNLIHTKDLYIEICKDKSIPRKELHSLEKFKSDISFSNLVSLGEKLHNRALKKFSIEKRQILEILFIISQSLANNILLLNLYEEPEKKYVNKVIEALNLLNYKNLSIDKIKKEISEIVDYNFTLINKLGDKIYNEYGNILQVSVSKSTRPNKAILVSGNNLKELYNVLEKSKDKNIDIYTHSNLLIAHSLEKFKEYKNLVGHFGSESENSMLDFATFPGAILLTKNAAKDIEYLYRGRLFSTDKTVPVGVTKIENNDYTPLIEAAINSRGFKNGREKNSINVGYDINTIKKKFDDIASKFNSGVIKQLIVIGSTTLNSRNNNYYNSLLSNIDNNTYVICFGGEINTENILSINLSNNLPLLYKFMNKLLAILNNEYNRITYFIDKCDANSLSSIVSLKEHGFNNIYLGDCKPTEINPQTVKLFVKLYDIKVTTNPQKDLENILKQ